MKVKHLPAGKALGHVLLHNVLGADGKRVVAKGLRLEASHLALLRSAGVGRVWVAIVESGDVREDEAAAEVAGMVAGSGLDRRSPARGGSVDLIAASDGMLQLDARRLLRLNRLPGLSVAAGANGSFAAAGKRVACVKVVPFALPRRVLESARGICAGGGGEPLLRLRPNRLRSAALLTVGRSGSRGELAEAFGASLRFRLEPLGIDLALGPHAAEDVGEICRALEAVLATDAQIVLIAGSTSIMDVDDLTPRAIRAAGGRIVRHGVPVEPGSLLLLAYRGDTPIVGVPGCARGRQRNALDLVLPRLAAGMRVGTRELLELGHGGLLD